MDRYNLWLTQLFGTANPKIHKVNAFYGTPAKTYEAISSGDHSVLDRNELKRLDYVTIDKADRWLDYCERTGISVCSLGSPEYPKLLAEIYDPPSLLYYRGDLSCLDVLSLTFVGTRHPSPYIMKLCSRITCDIGSLDITLVSGMAHGVDECVHLSCVMNGLRTVGVLACGIDVDYPYGSKVLREQIVMNGGAYMSEFLPNTTPTRDSFNPRNRILAGLTRGTAIFQAPMNSGALITGTYALEEGRDVFCVPPPILFKSGYEGVCGLLEDGAIPIFNHDDILNEYRGLYI